ncbi:3'-5' exonuclease [Thauera linaloolentis]|uniref:DNA polymerase III subunit epsilon n=1 Tax=Thauera linaloolentis (strain DSM 12138 / JCM 21573 / CCUG 41526 / CIP 105981 / IAM 15112 / NBRC 102519 / 47Lol) TaxID=1123367 RepID=N6Z610_THAL4|nr:3'-5' exonuclease [Thauera linaloolentis]ENO89818.1 DNA polymerase III subunit epsilon [Thauera linaloolentis 47Lol = DSM 12138]MCM8566993.1 3'-5' exonuclease [Thauera linaloolentis]
MEVVAVIDFETTGLSPAQGDRATEVAAVIVEGGRVVDRYQSLMNAGVRIPAYIEALTGISNTMVRNAPPAGEVMRDVSDFVGGIPLVAHNAAFDAKFWDGELARIQRSRSQDFLCSLLLSRRLLPLAPSHKLGALVEYAKLPVAGRYHRALADAEMAASLLVRLEEELRLRHRVPQVSVDLLRRIQRTPKAQLPKCLASAGGPSSSHRPDANRGG